MIDESVRPYAVSLMNFRSKLIVVICCVLRQPPSSCERQLYSAKHFLETGPALAHLGTFRIRNLTFIPTPPCILDPVDFVSKWLLSFCVYRAAGVLKSLPC